MPDSDGSAVPAQPDPRSRAQPVIGDGSESRTVLSPRPLRRATTTPTPVISRPASSKNSPREVSPIRLAHAAGVATELWNTRSRKNSQDLSPNRAPIASGPNIPTIPSAAAIQRALAAAGLPQIQSLGSPELAADSSRSQRPSKGLVGGLTPAPTQLKPPQVKSPPPSGASNKVLIYSSLKAEQGPLTPSIVFTPGSTSSNDRDAEGEDTLNRSEMRTPSRGISGNGPALETVQESSVPATPAITLGSLQSLITSGKDARPERIEENPMEDAFVKGTNVKQESGSESGGNKSAGAKDEGKVRKKSGATANSTKPPIIQSKKSFTQLSSTRGKPSNEGSVKNMIVETETVSSIPKVALGGGAGDRSIPGRTDTSYTIRLKASTETIRPKKERKKTVRKAPSLHSGTGGSTSRRSHHHRHHHHHHIYIRDPLPGSSFPQLPLYTDCSSGYMPVSHERTFPVRLNLLDDELAESVSDDFVHPSIPTSRSQIHRATLIKPRRRIASSKADIFEAKVASAVDEANSSNSEETFVYESNPPEPLSARTNRYHSRTPSATSIASQMDQYGARARGETYHALAGKKSMKFVNNPHHSTAYNGESGDRGSRLRTNSGQTGRGSARHHIGRNGRAGTGHTSIFDNESPFPNAAKPLRNAASNVSRLSSRPSTPKSPHVSRIGNSRKPNYDLEGEGADDERTPLVASIRSGRNRNSRRPIQGSQHDKYLEKRSHGICRRITAYVSLGSLAMLLVAAVIVILVMCSKPLLQVQIKDIQNVLASEQEIMLDLHVHAINPNLIAVQVSDLDVNIFAKSKYVGTNALWRIGHQDFPLERRRPSLLAASTPNHRRVLLKGQNIHTSDGIDEGTDPIEDPETDSQTMLLGRIFEFDSPLIFEPSPLRHHALSSIGEVRLAKPGNRTEEGGTERWEKVIQHPFELIVRGVIRYSLPISSRTRSASIGGSVIVKPNAEVKRNEPTYQSDRAMYHLKGGNSVLPKPVEKKAERIVFVA